MQPLIKRQEVLQGEIADALERLEITTKRAVLARLDGQLAEPGVWDDSAAAQQISKQAAGLRDVVEPWTELWSQADDLGELLELGDESIEEEIEQQLLELELEFAKRRKDLLFTGEFDGHGAILRLSAGVGGTDAQDFTEMLERMYLRWAEKSNLKTQVIERSSGDEAGIKSTVIEVDGSFAYGRLRSEHGVHRLVRLSPFNSDNLRQTSFALVEVLPVIDQPDEVKIDDKDLKIDVYRSGGHGGQSVNTTDSAVRVTHLPTGTVVAIQNERSQIQNRETAMKILRSKLIQLKDEQRAATIADLQAGESASWGAQIRNYVLHPYKQVKDTRTKHEDKDTQAVLDGAIDGFIEAYLESADQEA